MLDNWILFFMVRSCVCLYIHNRRNRSTFLCKFLSDSKSVDPNIWLSLRRYASTCKPFRHVHTSTWMCIQCTSNSVWQRSHLMRIYSMHIQCASRRSTLRGGLQPNPNWITNELLRCITEIMWQYVLRPNTQLWEMAAGLTDAETKALIAVWSEADVQRQLDSVKHNKNIYQRIAAELSKQGWSKSWKQCWVKVKNLTKRYQKVRICNTCSL